MPGGDHPAQAGEPDHQKAADFVGPAQGFIERPENDSGGDDAQQHRHQETREHLQRTIEQGDHGRRFGLSHRLSSERQQLFVGRELDVLIEKINREEGFAEGRSYREAPEVDGIVEVRNIRQSLQEGDIIKVCMTDAMPHDMIGEEAAK